MTKFEQMLLDKGYTKHIFNCKKMEYEIAKGHTISTMTNLDHRYIKAGVEILFGLHDQHKPPTLIYPRPRIEVTREREGEVVVETEFEDDSMNVVLEKIDHEEIYEAMFDESKVIRVDLIKVLGYGRK